LGKKLLSNQLVLQVFSLLEKVKATPTTLGWYDKYLQVISHAPTPTKEDFFNGKFRGGTRNWQKN
jgi:hypothetical protein